MGIGISICEEPGRSRGPLRFAQTVDECLKECIRSDLPFHTGCWVMCLVNSIDGRSASKLDIVHRKVVRCAMSAASRSCAT